jgi:hypothetical protein
MLYRVLSLAVFAWLFATISHAQSLQGMWFDSESNGFYEFQDTTTKEFIFETPDGERHKGTYEPQGKDQEGNEMYRAVLKIEYNNEERNLFIKVYPDGKTGYVQYKCMKKPFYKTKES